MAQSPAGAGRGRKKRPRITDIAQKCGLSISTVSIVLHNKPGIPADTRQRVIAAAEELGYSFQARGTHIVPEKLRQIGVVMKAIPLPNGFYSDVLSGIDQACNQFQLNLIFTTMQCHQHGTPIETPRMLVRGNFDGLIIVGAVIDAAFNRLIEDIGVPIVLLDGYSENRLFDSVVINNEEGGYLGVKHLIQNGHRHIAIAGSRLDGYPVVIERRQGYLRALQEAGIENRYFADSNLEADSAVGPITEFLTQYPQVTAIFACTDEIAIRVITVAEKLGRRVPDDLSVIGFDDIDVAQRIRPALTTLHVDRPGLGRLALLSLMQRIANPNAAFMNMVMHTRLVCRQSVKPLKL